MSAADRNDHVPTLEQVAEDFDISGPELEQLELAGGERLAVDERTIQLVDVGRAARHAGAAAPHGGRGGRGGRAGAR